MGRFVFFLLLTLWASNSGAAPREADSPELSDRQFIVELFQQGEDEFAAEEIESFESNYPKGSFLDEMLFLKGRVMGRMGRHLKAIDLFEQLGSSFPSSPYRGESEYYQGLERLALGQNERAIKELRNFAKNYPNSLLEVWPFLGQAYVGVKQYPKAARAYGFALEKKPQSLELRWSLAWALSWAGDEKRAHQEFEQLLALKITETQRAEILFQVATDHLKSKKYLLAYQGFKQQWSRYRHPTLDSKGRFWCAETVVAWGLEAGNDRIEEALWLLEQNQEQKTPLQPLTGLRHQAVLQGWLGRKAASLELYQQLIQKDPRLAKEVELTLHRAQLAIELGNRTLGRKILEEGVSQEGEVDLRLETRLWTFLVEEKDCAQIFEQQKRRAVKSEVGWYAVGSCEATAGRTKEAAAALRQLKPSGWWEAQGAVAYLSVLETEGADAEALALSERALEAKVKPRLFFLNAKLRLLAKSAPDRAIEFGEKSLETSTYLLGEPDFLLELAQAYGNPPSKPKRPLELYRLAQGQLEEDTKIKWVLEKRRSLLLGLKDYLGLLGLYQEALSREKDKAAQGKLRLEILRLQIQTGRSFAAEELQSLGGEPGPVGAQALEIAAELNIGQKKFHQAAQGLEKALAKKIDSRLSLRLHYRLAQVYQASNQWNLALTHYQKVSGSASAMRSQAKKQAQAIQDYLSGR